MSFKIFRLNGQSFHQACGICEEMRRAIKLCPQPFMWIKHEGIRALNSRPKLTKFRADHSRAGPSSVHMTVKAKLFGQIKHRCNIIAGARARATGTGDQPRRQIPCRNIGLNRCAQRRGVHAAAGATNGDTHEIVLTNARHPNGAIYRCVHFCRAINTQPRRSGQTRAIALPIQRPLAHGQDRRQCRRGG